jgi:hypothetical protein
MEAVVDLSLQARASVRIARYGFTSRTRGQVHGAIIPSAHGRDEQGLGMKQLSQNEAAARGGGLAKFVYRDGFGPGCGGPF